MNNSAAPINKKSTDHPAGYDPTKKIVNILSLDGGGIRGVLTAQILNYVESQLTGSMSDHFDIIAGTSTGGILAIGLCVKSQDAGVDAAKYSTKDMMELYTSEGKNIFSSSGWRRFKTGNGLWGAKFSNKGIAKVTEKYVGEDMLSNCRSNVLLTAYDIVEDRPVYFKSTDAISNPDECDFKMKLCCQATGAAPTFFPPVTLESQDGKEHILVDGGIIRNNPSTAALAYAKELYPKAETFNLLSLGTGRTKKSCGMDLDSPLEWIKGPLIHFMMSGSSQATDYEIQSVFKSLNEDSTYLRLQAILEVWEADMTNYSKSNLKNLQDTADQLIESHKEELDAFIQKLNQMKEQLTAAPAAKKSYFEKSLF